MALVYRVVASPLSPSWMEPTMAMAPTQYRRLVDRKPSTKASVPASPWPFAFWTFPASQVPACSNFSSMPRASPKIEPITRLMMVRRICCPWRAIWIPKRITHRAVHRSPFPGIFL